MCAAQDQASQPQQSSPIQQPSATSSQVQQVIIIIIPPLPPRHDNLLLLLIVRHGVEQLLELVLGHLLAQLARLRQHDEPVLDVGRALLLDQADAPQPVGRLGLEDLVEDRLARFGCLSEGLAIRFCFSGAVAHAHGWVGGLARSSGGRYLLVVCHKSLSVYILYKPSLARRENQVVKGESAIASRYSLPLRLVLAAAAPSWPFGPATSLSLELLEASLSDLPMEVSQKQRLDTSGASPDLLQFCVLHLAELRAAWLCLGECGELGSLRQPPVAFAGF